MPSSRQGNRSGSGSGNYNNSNSGSAANNKPKFLGVTEKLHGYVFEMNGGVSQYPRMIEKLQLYAGINYKETPEIGSLFLENPTAPTVAHPGNNATATGMDDKGNAIVSAFDQKLFEEAVKDHFQQTKKLRANLRSLFLVIRGQCNKVLQSHLETLADYETSRDEGNCTWLLTEIRNLTSKFNAKTYAGDLAFTALKGFYNLHQGNKPTAEYYRLYSETTKLLDINTAWAVPPYALYDKIKHKDATKVTNVIEQANKAQQALFAAGFILNADNKRFGSYKQALRTKFSRGVDLWPRTLVDAYACLLDKEKRDSDNNTREQRQERGRNQRNPQDRNGTRPGESTRIYGHQYHQSNLNNLPLSALFLDSLATHSVLKDLKLVRDVRKGEEVLETHTNGGNFCTDLRGSFIGFPGCQFEAWVYEKGLANILALCDVVRHCRVTMDSERERSIIVHCKDGTIFKFIEMENGLYGCYPEDNNATSNHVTAYSFLQTNDDKKLLNTVTDQKKLFTARQVKAADAA